MGSQKLRISCIVHCFYINEKSSQACRKAMYSYYEAAFLLKVFKHNYYFYVQLVYELEV